MKSWLFALFKMKGNWGWGTKRLSWAGDGSKQLWGMGWVWHLCHLCVPWAVLSPATKMHLGTSCWAMWLQNVQRVPTEKYSQIQPLNAPCHQEVSPLSSPPEAPQKACCRSNSAFCQLCRKNATSCCSYVHLWDGYLSSPAGPALFPRSKTSSSISFIHHHQQCTDINKTQTHRTIIVGYVN